MKDSWGWEALVLDAILLWLVISPIIAVAAIIAAIVASF